MDQPNPYPFRAENKCPCRVRCPDRTPTGRFLWMVAADATGPWASLTTARRLVEVPDVFGQCFWELRYEGGTDPELGIECVLQMWYDQATGPGVPFSWVVLLTFEVQSILFAGDFIAEQLLEVTEKVSCRSIPDMTPIVIADPPNPHWAPGHTPGEILTRWGGSVSPF